MSILSIRLNKEEEKILQSLMTQSNMDKSTIVKKSLFDLYENYYDKIEIEKFEEKEKKGKVSFISSDNVLKMINDTCV